MRKDLKKRKKKGFTLIEMVAVVAIIGILAAILVPKVTQYMNDAKKTKVVGQARMVNLAVETAIAKGEGVNPGDLLSAIDKDAVHVMAKYMEIQGADATASKAAFDALFDSGKSLDKLLAGMKVEDCKKIADGAEFEIETDGTFKKMS